MKSGTNISQFEILNRLGEGAFGQVYKVKRKDNQKFYAMKKIKMLKLSSKEKENALNEIRILASVSSPYIIKYKDAFYNDPSSELCIIMEFADKGDLQTLIQKCKNTKTNFEEQQLWTYAAQILMGLKSLHDLNILHRDLKGANVFLSENGNSIKLGDLNVSKVTKSDMAYTQTGTPYYLAPEVWKGEAYNSKCDIWSLGCVLYECCNLAPPFTATSLDQLYKKVLKGQYPKISDKFSQEMAKFIQDCLILSPKSRPSVKDLMEKPKIKPHINIDKKEEKAQLLKTMKLPYGGLHNLQNILPKAKYEEENKQEIQEQKQVSQQRQGTLEKIPEQQPSSLYKQRSERAQSASRPRQEPPSQYQQYQNQNYRPQSRNQAVNNQPTNQQQRPQQPPQQQQQNSKQSLAQYQQNQQVQQPVISNTNQRGSIRSNSSERLMKNYENNNYYQQNFGGYNYGQRQNQPSNIPKPQQQGAQKPPMQQKPAGYPSQQPQYPPQYGRR